MVTRGRPFGRGPYTLVVVNPAGIAAAVEREQRDALELWRSLADREWAARSLCSGWTVKDVAEHVVSAERGEFHRSIARALDGQADPPDGFDLARANEDNVTRLRARPVAELLTEAEAVIARTRELLAGLSEADLQRPAWNPIRPQTIGFYARGRVWEWWTHNQDVRIPLRRDGAREPGRVRWVVEVIRDGIPGVFIPERARGVHTSYAFRVGDVEFTIRIDDGTIRVDDAFDPKARVRITADPAAFALVGARRMSQMRAVLTGKFKPSGNPVQGLKFLKYFREP